MRARRLAFWLAAGTAGIIGLGVLNLAADKLPNVRGLNRFRNFITHTGE